MGRGLRLPFGRYTGVWQIDQLDIIAHQSFTELLNAENVLQQFGLDEAVPEPDKAKVEEVIRKAAEESNTDTSTDTTGGQPSTTTMPGTGAGTGGVEPQPSTVPGNGGDEGLGLPGVGVRSITAPEDQPTWE